MAYEKYSDTELDPNTGLTGKVKNNLKYLSTGNLGAMTRGEAEQSSRLTDTPTRTVFNGMEGSVYDEGLEYGEDVAQHRHEEQGFFGSLGSALVQTGATLAGQTLQGIGYLTDIEQIGNVLTGRETEFNNFLAQAGTDLIEAGADIAPIYQDPSKEGQVNLGDWSYWAANAPSIISTLSMMLPGMAVAGALGKIGAISKMGALAQWGIKGAAGALTSRYIEASMEAAPLVKQFEDLVGKQLTMSQAQQIKKEYGIDIPGSYNPETGSIGFYITPELAKEAGGKAAANNFKANMALIATDLPQFLVATAPFGSISKAVTKTMAKTLGKEFMPILAKKGAATAFEMATEGTEEGYQYITSEDAKNVELQRMGLIEKSELSDRVAKYVTDGEFTTSAIFGALGAGVMMGAMKGINKLKAKKNGGQSEDELRLENAESWAPTLNAYTAALKEAETAGDTKAYERIHNDFMTSLEIKAAANQNSDALIDFIEAGKSGEAKDIEELGFDENTAKHLKENGDKIIEKLKATGKVFQQNLNETGGNRTQAEILTLADVKVDNYTDAARQSSLDVNKIINDDKNWVPANGQTNIPVPTRLKDATRLDEEATHWNNKLSENTAALAEAESKVGTGKESFIVNELKRKNDLIKSNLDRVAKERESLNYTKEEHVADLNLFSLKPTVKNEISKSVKEKTTNEYELADNLYASKFYRTEEGKSLLDKKRYEVSKNEVVNAVKSVIEKDKEIPQSPLDLINQMREADGVDLGNQVDSVVNENVSSPKVDIGSSVNLNEIEQQIESDKNIAIKEQERLAKEDRRLNNSVSILNAIDKLKVSKQTVLEDAQSLEDTVSYLHELLYQVGDLSFDNVSSIEKQIKELNKIISSKSSKLTRHGNLTGKRIELLKENIKDEFTLLNDLTNRIQYLKEQIAQLEEISRDLDNQMNYYHNLISDKSFETLNKEELTDRIKSIKRKQSVLERLISNLKKSIEKSIEIISHYVKYTVDSIKRLTKFETETSFKRLSVSEIQDAIRNNDNSIDNYSQLSQEYDKLEAEVLLLISDTELVEGSRVNEAKHIEELQNKLRVYDNQIRYIEELINGDLSLIEKEDIVFNENLDKDIVESVVEQSIPEPVVKRRPGRPKKNPEKVVVPKTKSSKSNKKNTVANEVVTPEEVAPEVVYPEDSIDNGLFREETYFDNTLEYTESQESINAKKRFETTFNNNYGENALVNLATDMLKFMKDNPQFKDEIESNLSSVEGFKDFVMQIIQESIDNDNESAKELRTKLAQFYSDKNKVVEQAKANAEATAIQTKPVSKSGKYERKFTKIEGADTNFIAATMYTNKDVLGQDEMDRFEITPDDVVEIALHTADKYAEGDSFARKFVLFVRKGNKIIVIGNLPAAKRGDTTSPIGAIRAKLDSYYKDQANIVKNNTIDTKVKGTAHKMFVYMPNGNKFTSNVAGYVSDYSIDIKEVDGVDKVQRHSPNTKDLIQSKASSKKADATNSLLDFMKRVGGFALGFIKENSSINWCGEVIPNLKDDIKVGISNTDRLKLSNKLISDNGVEIVATYIKPHDVAKATKRAELLGVSYEDYIQTTYGEQRGFDKEEYGSDAITSAKKWIEDQYKEESNGSLFVGIPNPAAPWDTLIVRAFYRPMSELTGEPKKVLLERINKALSENSKLGTIRMLENLEKVIFISEKDNKLIKDKLSKLSKSEFIKVIAALQQDQLPEDMVKEYGILKSILNNARIKANKELFNKPAGEWTDNAIGDNSKPYNDAIADYIFFTIKPETPLNNVSIMVEENFTEQINVEKFIPVKPVDNAIQPEPVLGNVGESVVSNEEILEESQKAVVDEIVVEFTTEEKPNPTASALLAMSEKEDDEFDEENDEVVTEKPIDEIKDVKLYQSTETVAKDSKEELEWFKKYFPNISINELEEIRDMVRNVTSGGHTAWAAYHNAAIWVRDNMPEGTVYHEAFHVIFNLALTEKEINQLLFQAEGVTIEEKEEWLADKFKEILLGRKADKSTKGFMAKIFRKLKQFLNSIWTNKNSFNLHELANRVEQGRYTKLRTSNFNDPTLRLYKEIAGWDYAKSKIATDSINKYVVTMLLPYLRSTYPAMTDMTDAEVMTSYIQTKKDTYACQRDIRDMLKMKADTLTGSAKANLLDLVSKMFSQEGKTLPLVFASWEELNKNQGIIVKINSVENKSVSIEEYMEAIDDDTSKAEVYDVNFISKSSKNTAPSKVKNVLRYLKTREKNEFGLPKYYGYDQTYNTLLKQLSGITTVKEMKEILTKNVKNYPQYKQLLKMIKDNPSFGTSMFQAFNRPNMTFLYLYADKDGNVKVMDANKSGVSDSVYKGWAYGFNNKKSNFVKGKVSGANGEKKLIEFNAIAKNLLSDSYTREDVDNLSSLLNSIGIDISSDTLSSMMTNPAVSISGLLTSNYNSFLSIFKAIEASENPFEGIGTEDKKSIKRLAYDSLKKIANMVKNNSPSMFETSHISVGKEKVYSQIVPQFISTLVHNLHDPKNVLDILDSYSKDPLFATGREITNEPFNIIRDFQVDLKTNKPKVVFNNIILQKCLQAFIDNKYQYSEIPGAIDNNIEKENKVRERLNEIVNIAVLEGKNIYNSRKEYSKYEDNDLKHAAMTLFFNNKSQKKVILRMPPLSDSPNMLTIAVDKLSKEDATTAIINIATGEYNRIQNLAKNDAVNLIKNYDDDASLKSTKTGYVVATMFNGFEGNPSDNVEAAKQFINEYFAKQARDYANKLAKYKLVVMNGAQINKKESKLGKDLLNYMDNKDGVLRYVEEMLMNTMVSVSGMSLLSIGDPAFYKGKDGSVAVDYIKRAKEIFSPKSVPDTSAAYQVHEKNGKFRETVNAGTQYISIYVKDVEIFAPSINAIISFLQSQVDSGNITQKEMNDIINNYNKVNHTDAQAFITPSFYRRTMVAHDLWTDAMQRAYDNLIEGIGTGADIITLQPIKPFMFDQRLDSSRNLMIPNQHKNSEFILFPQLVNGETKLKALYDYMNKNNVDIANFNSAVKVGESSAIGFDELTSGAQTPLHHIINMEHRGIQQATPEHHIGSTGPVSTQLQVNAIANLTDKDKDGNDVIYTINGRPFTHSQLQNHYIDLIEASVIEAYDNVKDEFLTNGKLDWVKVSSILKLAAEGEQLPEDFVASISYNSKTGKINLPPFDPLFGTKMESIFHSMARNKITKQKINQASLIQLSSVGLNNDLKLVFKSQEDRTNYEKDLVESENITIFAELSDEYRIPLEAKGYNEELWRELTKEEQEHAKKCATV